MFEKTESMADILPNSTLKVRFNLHASLFKNLHYADFTPGLGQFFGWTLITEVMIFGKII